MNEKELELLVAASQSGDMDSYARIVRSFQDMAYGYAYAILGDFHLAEDAAQEAFVEAYYNLSKLHDVAAFPGWFRKIVYYRCNRFIRGKDKTKIQLDDAQELHSFEPDPQKATEDKELKNAIIKAIKSLSGPLCEATTLFYINGYSHKEISDFLDVPVNTVKSRLNASRKQLKEKVIEMAKEIFSEHKPGDDFTRKVIDGVPSVGFYKGGKKCPESYSFSSCLSACLQYMGKDYGFEEIAVHDTIWKLNKTYVYIMGTSGEAFRLFWKTGWHLDNVGIVGQEPDAKEFIDCGFEAIGYSYEMIFKDPKDSKSEKLMRQQIVKEIQEHQRPIIGFGVVGPPECCIITGYDQEGEVLIGWSFFQKEPEFVDGLEYEPSGYFRKRDWFKDTYALILFGKENKQLSRSEIYHKSLKRIIDLARRPTINLGGERHNGLAAYQVWADAILQDDDFPAGKMDILRECHMSHNNMTGMVAEGRWYGSLFLKQIIKDEPELAGKLELAIACYEAEHKMMWEIWGLVGGIGLSDDNVKKFAKPEIRRQIAPIILKTRDKDAEAAEIIEKALAH
jgi:RNA polymerase sigma factor (sigma-70 family)